MKLKENKGMSLIVFTVILAILVVVAGGVIVYLLNNPAKENVGLQTPSSAQTNVSNNENDVVKVEQTKEMSADEKFAEYVKNLKTIMLKYNKEETEGKEYREYIIDGKDSNDKTYSITLSGKGVLQLNEKEVANNVIGFNVAYTGNGGYKNLYFIKDDGTVAYTSIDETEYLSNGKIKVIDINGLKNIVSIMGGIAGTYGYPGTCYGYAIDIEGNIFEI